VRSYARERSVFIGYDPREVAGFAVARHSIRRFDRYTPISGLVLGDLRNRGLYSRPTQERTNSDGRRQLWDIISDAPMSTEFSISRFLVPHLASQGWALFVDGDVMALRNLSRVFDMVDSQWAVMCVKHRHQPEEGTKMDGQLQTQYARKNWSSVMLFNCEHPSNRRLTVEMVNTLPGRDLHRFCWLGDDEIGELSPDFNYLVGSTQLADGHTPALVHFTRGLPDMAGYEDQEYADEWREMLPYAVGAL
jgi:lipopolysaccharide biosynthesis glycosyltransferase